MRGFGIAADAGLNLASEVAEAAEALGYDSVWTNDTPGGDGLATASAMLRATQRVRVGVGALPCDRWSVRDVASRLESLDIPLQRFSLVVGAGRVERPLKAVGDAVRGLRDLLGPQVEVGIAALGPRMCRLAGKSGSLVLLNWSTPAHILRSRKWIDEGVARNISGALEIPSGPRVSAYVRMAVGPDAGGVLDEEAGRYRTAPHYAKHFEAMGRVPGVAADSIEEAVRQISLYDGVLDETVVRAVVTSDTPDAYLSIARAAAPGLKSPG